MTTIKRIFCERTGDSVRFSKDGAAMSLKSADKYTEMPAPLLRLYELAFYQLPNWNVKLCGIYEMGMKNERFGMLVSSTADIPPHVKTDLLNLNIGVEDFGAGDATILFIPAGINNPALAAVLFVLHTLNPLEEFASATFEADPPIGAEKKWAEIAQHERLPLAFNPGIDPKYARYGVIYAQFFGVGQENAIVQQEGWNKWVPNTERERCTLMIKISKRVLSERFENNLVSMVRFIQTRLSELSKQSKENKESLSWRNLVFRLGNSEFPGYWDTTACMSNVSFVLEVNEHV